MKNIISKIFFLCMLSITSCFTMQVESFKKQEEPLFSKNLFMLIYESLKDKDYDQFKLGSSFEIIYFGLDHKPYVVLSSFLVKNFKTQYESMDYYEFSAEALKNKWFDLTHWFYHAVKYNSMLKKQIKENFKLNMFGGVLLQRNQNNLFDYEKSHIFIKLTHKVNNKIQKIKDLLNKYTSTKPNSTL